MTNTENRVDTEACVERIESVCMAVVARDLEGVLDHFAEDCVFVNGVTGTTVPGKAELVNFLNDIWASFPEYTPRPVAAHLEQTTLGMLFETTVELPATDEKASPDGTKVRWLTSSFFTFDPTSMKIIRDVYYADEAAVEQMINEAGRAG
ncbi:nuclear transport factor 2 family protein [Rhodococcus opacus]|uniref:SnoaL-like domain-containing protein n=1 Tax=Rhodococcus opacus (strain B4) TaxID=632772 RepID=C1ASB3_RHOOB|nr:nuclear transport factor 2 family protein [Rhodococcus opacus]BAH48362.1 hypothetical protein ROP_01150 [Rhodococcus opacus B4]